MLLAAVARRAAWRVFEHAPDLVVVTTEETMAEVREYLPVFAERYRLDLEVLFEAAEVLPVERYTATAYQSHVAEARRYLEKRDPDDIPLAALALKLGIPIWSNDDDFTVLPVEVYSTARLLKVLGL